MPLLFLYKFVASRPSLRIFRPGSFFFKLWSFFSGELFYEVLSRSQYFSPKDIEHIQEKRLLTLMNHARNTTPFYREYLKTVESVSDFYNLEPLSKARMKVEFETGSVVNQRLYSFGSLRHTSGSTGIPLNYYYDENVLGRKYAMYRRMFDWTGRSKDDLLVTIQPFNLVPKIFEILDPNVVYFECGEPRWIDANLDALYKIFEGRSVMLFSRPSELIRLAQLIEQKGNNFQFKAILATGEQVTSEVRSYLEKVFGAPLFVRYGSDEVMVIAHECEIHDGFHVNSELVKIEIVDANNRPVLPEERGDIVVTSFDNEVMPFIRYRLGDSGAWYKNPCPCGRTLPRIKLWGRNTYFFLLPNGEIGYFYALVKPLALKVNKILQYQVVRHSLKRWAIKIVPTKLFNTKDKELILESFYEYLGRGAEVTIEVVDAIEETQGRKQRPFLNLCGDLPLTEVEVMK